MGLASREKGKRGEREVAQALRDLGFDARRTQQYAGADGTADIRSSISGTHWEVKRYAKIAALRFLDQARRDAPPGDVAVVACREDGGPWVIQVELANLPTLARKIVAALERSTTTSE